MTDSNNSGCFSGIVRLLLCKGSLQTHPSDQITEPNNNSKLFNHVKEIKNKAKVEAPGNAAPGVVARLMGLDSLPDANWVPKGKSPDSVQRSRSVNFMDYLLELDLAQAQQQQHRRVRTSVSFREVPTLLTQDNHDFLVLYLNNVDKAKKVGSETRKCEEKDKNNSKIREGIVNKNEKKNEEKKTKLKHEPRIDSNKRTSSTRFGSCKGAQVSAGFVSPCNKKDVNKKCGETSKASKSPMKPINQKEVLVESKFMKKMKKNQVVKDLHSDCSSQGSSPVSSLSLSELSVYQEIDTLSHGDTRLHMDLSSKKQPSLTTTSFSFQSPVPTCIFNSGDLEPRVMKIKDYEFHQNENTEYYMQLLRKLCSLTEEDIKVTNWVGKKKISEFESCEELCTEFGQQILDVILLQIVEELMGF